MPEPLRVMLVDDHYLVRVGLADLIALESDMTVCAAASSGEQALELYRSHRPHVTLMDLRLPGMDGAETTQAIRAEDPNARVIVLSAYAEDEEIYTALQAGAMAYLVKSVQRKELIETIHKAAAGQRHIPAELADRVAARVARSELCARVSQLPKGGRSESVASIPGGKKERIT
jgi:DNA-binding NarL/FixJ family response regulator